MRLAAWFGWLLDVLDLPVSETLEGQSAQDPDDPIVLKAETSARRGINHGLTVDELARESGLSRDALTRRFVRARGLTPGTMLIRLRYDQAARELVESGKTIAEIIRQAGFRSVSAFSRGFRQRYGVSPGSFRRQAAQDLV